MLIQPNWADFRTDGSSQTVTRRLFFDRCCTTERKLNSSCAKLRLRGERCWVGGVGGGQTREICTRRAGKLKRARSQLYRSQILQENMRWKALAEIYTTHSFAPFWNPYAKTGEKGAWPKQPRKGRKQENERPISSAQQAT